MLILFYKPTCPYCQRVLGEAEDLGVSFNLRNIASDEANVEALLEHGGKRQVPYLVDEERDVAMYESGDIMEYLREHYPNGNNTGEVNGVKIHKSDDTCESCQ